MTIYLKLKERAEVKAGAVKLKDVAEFLIHGEAKGLSSLSIAQMDTKPQSLSVIDIVKAITTAYPQCEVNNVGVSEVLLMPKQKPQRRWLERLKAAAVAATLFAGSMTAIMSFHTDSQMGQIFTQYYRIFFDEESQRPLIIHIPYAIGLALGIIIFFNHAAKKRVTKDPSPIEVAMVKYGQDVDEAVKDGLKP